VRFRVEPVLIACLVVGAVLGFFLPEFGVLGIVVLPASLLLLGLFLVQGDTRARLRRIGAFLIGGGVGGTAPLLALVIRIGNICPGTVQPQRAGVLSYACYSIETLWALIGYGAIVCLGVLLIFLARRQGAEPTTA
jgi:hypothetical protein